MSRVRRYRGDTHPERFRIMQEGLPVNLSGAGDVVLTVNKEQDPENTDEEQFSIIGSVINPTEGVVGFPISAANSDLDPEDEYYYDIQITDSDGHIRTLVKGQWVIQQDITKS